MPLQATSGAASYDAFGGGAAAVPNYIEDVFSTYLYTGTGATQTITNGIDLSTKGGLVWGKGRSAGAAYNHRLQDTVRGTGVYISSNTTTGDTSQATGVTAFNTTGFTLGSNALMNQNNETYVSWTFRKQPKFFDIQTWTGSGANRTISHALGSVPGCIWVKRTDTTGDWQVYHRSLANTQYLVLNSTAAAATGATRWNSTTPTSSVFSLGTDATVNASAGTYVAYIFAHDAGGFGLTGTDNVISCGSYTGTSAVGNAQTLGYEPQWILIKNITTAGYDWTLIDTMRGWATNRADAELYANSSSAEYFADNLIDVTATGFNFSVSGETALNTSGNTYIYIAIRRGPMKVPTTGTSVFAPVTYTGDGSTTSGQLVTAGFPVDMGINRYNRGGAGDWDIVDRLRGLTSIGVSPNSRYLNPYNTNAEASGGYIFDATNTSVDMYGFSASFVQLNYLFSRAPSFFDEVCYTGDGTTPQNITHNLSVAPEMMIIKCRSNASTSWVCYHKGVNGGVNPQNYYMLLQSDQAQTALSTIFNDTAPTSSVFTVGAQGSVGLSGRTHVAYLFATCAGVSKVGSYTGTATTKQIDCGFTAGARFVLIKRTDSTGDWYVWDTARGIVSGNDPYLLLNSTAAEVTNTDYIDTYSAGFEISSTAPAAINANGGTYIFLAIA